MLSNRIYLNFSSSSPSSSSSTSSYRSTSNYASASPVSSRKNVSSGLSGERLNVSGFNRGKDGIFRPQSLYALATEVDFSNSSSYSSSRSVPRQTSNAFSAHIRHRPRDNSVPRSIVIDSGYSSPSRSRIRPNEYKSSFSTNLNENLNYLNHSSSPSYAYQSKTRSNYLSSSSSPSYSFTKSYYAPKVRERPLLSNLRKKFATRTSSATSPRNTISSSQHSSISSSSSINASHENVGAPRLERNKFLIKFREHDSGQKQTRRHDSISWDIPGAVRFSSAATNNYQNKKHEEIIPEGDAEPLDEVKPQVTTDVAKESRDENNNLTRWNGSMSLNMLGDAIRSTTPDEPNIQSEQFPSPIVDSVQNFSLYDHCDLCISEQKQPPTPPSQTVDLTLSQHVISKEEHTESNNVEQTTAVSDEAKKVEKPKKKKKKIEPKPVINEDDSTVTEFSFTIKKKKDENKLIAEKKDIATEPSSNKITVNQTLAAPEDKTNAADTTTTTTAQTKLPTKVNLKSKDPSVTVNLLETEKPKKSKSAVEIDKTVKVIDKIKVKSQQSNLQTVKSNVSSNLQSGKEDKEKCTTPKSTKVAISSNDTLKPTDVVMELKKSKSAEILPPNKDNKVNKTTSPLLSKTVETKQQQQQQNTNTLTDTSKAITKVKEKKKVVAATRGKTCDLPNILIQVHNDDGSKEKSNAKVPLIDSTLSKATTPTKQKNEQDTKVVKKIEPKPVVSSKLKNEPKPIGALVERAKTSAVELVAYTTPVQKVAKPTEVIELKRTEKEQLKQQAASPSTLIVNGSTVVEEKLTKMTKQTTTISTENTGTDEDQTTKKKKKVKKKATEELKLFADDEVKVELTKPKKTTGKICNELQLNATVNKDNTDNSNNTQVHGVKRVQTKENKTKNDSKVNLNKAPKKIRFREYTVDDFIFLAVLGRGSFGKVMLAELKDHNVYFAVKCLKKQTVIEDDDVESIMIERKVLAYGSSNPFICKLFCTFQNESHLFFAMEWCAGGDLMFHVQKEGKFSEDKARFYTCEMLCALRFMHKRGIIYRDLKLDNIMIFIDGHIRLVDFGMCQGKMYREELLPSNFCGTPEYMAPEIIKGVKYNHSVDYWALGVVIYEMCVGTSPFQGTDEDELLWNVCNQEVHYPRFLSVDVKNLISLLLKRDPKERLGTETCQSGNIESQSWLNGVNWDMYEKCKVKPPFIPQLMHTADVSYFDQYFTKEEPAVSTGQSKPISEKDQLLFEGFNYTNHNMTE